MATGDLPIVIGTAGHVDHGKTTLIKALTGVDTDRLAEEKRRGLTIDLGFAPFILPSGRTASVVDVPGHERFLKNMLAGVGGMDLVLLVVAADDGVMPQTREHLDILRLLHVQHGVVVVTKRDLVETELLELAIADIQETLVGSFLEDAPLVPVSATTGEGLEDLLSALDRLAAETITRDAVAPARLPIDRVFVKQGFGAVVTGTLLTGSLGEGESIELQPSGLKGRARGLQVHGGKRASVQAGQRVAINVAGLSHSDFDRGEWLVAPGLFGPATVVDVWLELLAGSPAVEHRDRVRVHHGTSEVIGRLALLEADKLPGGSAGFAQLLLETPLVADFGDRFVIRRYSPAQTLGGGQILDPRARRWKRRHAGLLARLAAYREGRLADAAESVLEEAGLEPITAGQLESHVPFAARSRVLKELESRGVLYRLEPGFVHSRAIAALTGRLTDVLTAFHAAHPHRAGMAREALQAELQVPPARLAQIMSDLAERNRLRLIGRLAGLSSHESRFEGPARQAAEALTERVSAGLVDETDLLKDLPEVAREILEDRVEAGQILKLGQGIHATRTGIENARSSLALAFRERPQLTASQIKEALGTSRRFLIPLLEYLDQIGFTRRQGDVRTLTRPGPEPPGAQPPAGTRPGPGPT